jgi:hypothetical protein
VIVALADYESLRETAYLLRRSTGTRHASLPADIRQAAQIIAVMFPSIWLLGFPEKDCKVSQKVVQEFLCMAF